MALSKQRKPFKHPQMHALYSMLGVIEGQPYGRYKFSVQIDVTSILQCTF